MRKFQALLAIAALFAAPLALLARSGAGPSCKCTMRCCMRMAHHGSMAGMADCRHTAQDASHCAGWRCHCRTASDGSLAVPWLPMALPSLAELALPGSVGPAATAPRTDFTSAWPTKDPPPPRS
jgi:hypothetical protein